METSGLLLYHGAMKYTVTNNSSAPHDLMTLNGRVVALPGKPVDAYFDAGIAGVYAAVPFFDVQPAVNEAPNRRDPLDHDGDGRKGGFAAGSPDETGLSRRKPGRPRKES